MAATEAPGSISPPKTSRRRRIELSPLNRGRWARFRANRRGYWSLWIFLGLFGLSLFSEVLANEVPLLARHRGRWLFPLFRQYTEKDLGGDLDTAADYRDPYVQGLVNSDGWMLWPPIRFSYGTINYDLPSPAPSPPTWTNLLGTDDKGRDVLARVIYGFRLSVLFGFTFVILTAVIGVVAGALQGYFGGALDLWGQRLIEVWSSLPTLYILIILTSVIEPSFWSLQGVMVLFGWMGLVGLVRAEFLRSRNFEYVLAAKAMGMGNARVMFRHILPNAMVAVMTFLPFDLGGSITLLTSLDFLGYGLPVGSPSLGELVAEAKVNIQAPWLGITSFVVLGGTLLLLIFIGEAVRDAMDPRRAA